MIEVVGHITSREIIVDTVNLLECCLKLYPHGYPCALMSKIYNIFKCLATLKRAYHPDASEVPSLSEMLVKIICTTIANTRGQDHLGWNDGTLHSKGEILSWSSRKYERKGTCGSNGRFIPIAQ